MILALHTLAGMVALVTGAVNLLSRKGTRRHRLVDRLYAATMYHSHDSFHRAVTALCLRLPGR